MVKRLVDRFAVGDRVKIRFKDDSRWFPAEVIAHDHPGVWVRAEIEGGNQRLFVTNGQRIRFVTDHSEQSP